MEIRLTEQESCFVNSCARSGLAMSECPSTAVREGKATCRVSKLTLRSPPLLPPREDSGKPVKKRLSSIS